MSSQTESLTRKQKVANEVKLYLAISFYLWLCLGAIVLYSATLLQDRGVTLTALPYGMAAAKALVMAKFILLGHELKIGERLVPRPLVLRVLVRSIFFLALLFVLTGIEEFVLGFLHHKSIAEVIAERVHGRWLEIGAHALLVWLFLVPYLAFRALEEVIGRDEVKRIFLGRA